ncbi:MAG: MFS transporter [Chitinophagaceae bacterium]
MQLPHIYRSLKYRNYRLYFTGQSISLIGTWMQRMAVSWLIFRVTHSAYMLGLAAFASQFPTFILSPYAGVITDRYNRHRILLITQTASMIQASILAYSVLSGHFTITEILLLSALLGTINSFDIPSRQSLMIDLVEDRAQLSNAIALNSTMVNFAKLIGPAIAGVLLATVGEGICFLLNALSFLAVITSILLLRIPKRKIKKNQKNMIGAFREGLAYLRRSVSIKGVIGMLAMMSLVGMPYATLVPIFAKDIFHGNASTYGWLTSAAGLGALGGAFYLASLRSNESLIRVIAFSSALLGVGLWLFAATGFLVIGLLSIMATGFAMMTLIAATNTAIQTTVSDHMRGRVLSFYVMAFQGMQPIGSFLAGNIAHRIGASETVMGQAVLCLLGTLGFIYYFKKNNGGLNLSLLKRTS